MGVYSNMPIYELQCTKCNNKVEKLFTAYINFISEAEMKDLYEKEHQLFLTENKMSGYEIIDTFPSFDYWLKGITPQVQTCDCGGFMELIPSLPSMQPDNMWSGQVKNGQYFTSKKQYNNYIKENNLERVDRSTYEQVQKKASNRVSDHIQKTKKAKEQAIVDVVKHLDLPND